MSAQEVFVQEFEMLFRHHCEGLSLEKELERASWNSMSPDERDRLVAAARLAVLELAAHAKILANSERYFAKPGEAEWGC
jgi:hypothetical protein